MQQLQLLSLQFVCHNIFRLCRKGGLLSLVQVRPQQQWLKLLRHIGKVHSVDWLSLDMDMLFRAIKLKLLKLRILFLMLRGRPLLYAC